jgi:hypothetical protein
MDGKSYKLRPPKGADKTDEQQCFVTSPRSVVANRFNHSRQIWKFERLNAFAPNFLSTRNAL